MHGLLSSLPWIKDAMSTAGGLAAAAGHGPGVGRRQLVLRRDPGQLPAPERPPTPQRLPTTSTTSPTAGQVGGRAGPVLGSPSTVTSTANGGAPTIDGAGNTGTADPATQPIAFGPDQPRRRHLRPRLFAGCRMGQNQQLDLVRVERRYTALSRGRAEGAARYRCGRRAGVPMTPARASRRRARRPRLTDPAA